MDGSFIPPPFPFPEAWPRVFAEQQHERKWLTPTTFVAVQSPAPMTAGYYYPVDPSIHATAAQDEDTEEDEEDSEYEYGYVLSDEWRERFQSSVYLQQQQQQQQKIKAKMKKKPQHKKKVKQQRKTVNAEAIAAARASRSGHLLHEIQAAKTRELTRKWKRRGGGNTSSPTPQIEALETSLNMFFDEFCDAFQPAVWPHDPLQR